MLGSSEALGKECQAARTVDRLSPNKSRETMANLDGPKKVPLTLNDWSYLTQACVGTLLRVGNTAEWLGS